MEDDSLHDLVVVVIDETERGVDTDRWADLVRRAQAGEGVRAPAETNVVFVDEPTIAQLNADHMGVDGATDVLSFPIDDDPTMLEADEVRLVGDIALCWDVAERNAADHAGSLDDEIALLLIHATLHLLGHDHVEPDERALMWASERRLMNQLWTPLSRDPWQES